MNYYTRAFSEYVYIFDNYSLTIYGPCKKQEKPDKEPEKCHVVYYHNNEDLSKIEKCHLKGIKNEDLKALAEYLNQFENLKELHLSGTEVSEISPLKDLTNLTYLDLSGTQVSEISPLKDLKSLEKLNLSGTKVSDINVLKDLKSLKELHLSGTKVSDTSPLKDLTGLTCLDLSGTQVSYEDAQELVKKLPNCSIIGIETLRVNNQNRAASINRKYYISGAVIGFILGLAAYFAGATILTSICAAIACATIVAAVGAVAKVLDNVSTTKLNTLYQSIDDPTNNSIYSNEVTP